MNTRRLSLAAAMLAVAALAGCKEVGPNYKAPAMPASTTKADEDAAWQKQLDFLHIPLSAGQDASISH